MAVSDAGAAAPGQGGPIRDNGTLMSSVAEKLLLCKRRELILVRAIIARDSDTQIATELGIDVTSVSPTKSRLYNLLGITGVIHVRARPEFLKQALVMAGLAGKSDRETSEGIPAEPSPAGDLPVGFTLDIPRRLKYAGPPRILKGTGDPPAFDENAWKALEEEGFTAELIGGCTWPDGNAVALAYFFKL